MEEGARGDRYDRAIKWFSDATPPTVGAFACGIYATPEESRRGGLHRSLKLFRLTFRGFPTIPNSSHLSDVGGRNASVSTNDNLSKWSCLRLVYQAMKTSLPLPSERLIFPFSSQPIYFLFCPSTDLLFSRFTHVHSFDPL